MRRKTQTKIFIRRFEDRNGFLHPPELYGDESEDHWEAAYIEELEVEWLDEVNDKYSYLDNLNKLMELSHQKWRHDIRKGCFKTILVALDAFSTEICIYIHFNEGKNPKYLKKRYGYDPDGEARYRQDSGLQTLLDQTTAEYIELYPYEEDTSE